MNLNVEIVRDEEGSFLKRLAGYEGKKGKLIFIGEQGYAYGVVIVKNRFVLVPLENLIITQ